MIRFQEVSYTYLSQGSEEVQSPSMDHISFHIPKGQCVVLCGKSGCGKTTLLRIINGPLTAWPAIFTKADWRGMFR